MFLVFLVFLLFLSEAIIARKSAFRRLSANRSQERALAPELSSRGEDGYGGCQMLRGETGFRDANTRQRGREREFSG